LRQTLRLITRSSGNFVVGLFRLDLVSVPSGRIGRRSKPLSALFDVGHRCGRRCWLGLGLSKLKWASETSSSKRLEASRSSNFCSELQFIARCCCALIQNDEMLDTFIGRREEVYLTYRPVDSSFVCVLRICFPSQSRDVRYGKGWNGDRRIHGEYCIHLIHRIPRPLPSSAAESMERDQCY
jgi:hypothetical protein